MKITTSYFKFFLPLLLIACTTMACRRCFKCEGNYVCVQCYKGTDTARTCNWAESSLTDDHLNQYKPQGYTCDTFDLYYVEDGPETCDLALKKSLEENGLDCKRFQSPN